MSDQTALPMKADISRADIYPQLFFIWKNQTLILNPRGGKLDSTQEHLGV